MPKAAPTQVIVHRIELQQTERQLLESAVAAYSFRNVSRGIYNLTHDTTTIIALIIIYEWISGNKVLNDAFMLLWGAGGDLTEALVQNWRDYRQTQEYSEDYQERATSVVGGLRNLLDNLIGAFTGEYIQNLDEQLNNS